MDTPNRAHGHNARYRLFLHNQIGFVCWSTKANTTATKRKARTTRTGTLPFWWLQFKRLALYAKR
jgi:hypothetical protein